uniref:Uncharacterized protein n=1 Tax=Arundo donax TaxID=35708 RepID=A0A0A9HN92_ARUDO
MAVPAARCTLFMESPASLCSLNNTKYRHASLDM